MSVYYTKKRFMRAKLIFNPGSGVDTESPVQLMDVIKEMQAWKYMPEVYLIKPNSGCDLKGMIKDSVTQGIKLFVACGGDGTVSSVASALVGLEATLGIIPTGTKNNIALSLGIPEDIPSAAALLRKGRHIKIDAGVVVYKDKKTPFVEICSVGLFSSLFPSSDEILHGNLSKIGDFLSTLVSSPPAHIELIIDGNEKISEDGHVVLVSNMPYSGSHFQLGREGSFKDGLLDVLLFAELSKVDLLGYVFKGGNDASSDDPRIQHYQVSQIDIATRPPMNIMADGNALGKAPVSIKVLKEALAVIVSSDKENTKEKRILVKAGESFD